MDDSDAPRQQVVVTYQHDKDVQLERHMGFKSGDTVAFDALNPKAFGVMMERRPEAGWMALLEARYQENAPPPPPEPEE